MRSGAAPFDIDNDGDLDIYFVNGATLRELPPRPKADKAGTSPFVPMNKLFANNDDGAFTDVTTHAGVTVWGVLWVISTTTAIKNCM